MRELVHDHLFAPPAGTRIVVFPIAADVRVKKAAPMDSGYAALARAKWPNLPTALNFQMRNLGATVMPLTLEDDVPQKDGSIRKRLSFPGNKAALPPKFHLVALPTRRYKEARIELEDLIRQLRLLQHIPETYLHFLTEGSIVMPQICDGPDRPWAYWKPLLEPWLDDRVTVISGKVGTDT